MGAVVRGDAARHLDLETATYLRAAVCTGAAFGTACWGGDDGVALVALIPV